MKRNRFLMAVVAGMLLTCGCSGYLEEVSQDEVIPTTTTDYSEMLLAYMYKTDNNEYDLIHALGDECIINDHSLSDVDHWFFVNIEGVYTWQPDMWERDNTMDDGYEYTYTQLMGINAVLDGIDDAVGDQEDRDIVKAEALTLRAFGYFMLVNLYGEPYNYNKEALGVPLKLEAALVENGIARSTVEEVYAQMVEDLERASDLFARYPKRRGNFRVNGTTTDILLSRVYLHMEEWDKAIEAANRAIESAEGLTDYTTISTEETFYLAAYDNEEVEWMYGYVYFNNLVFTPSPELLSLYMEGDRRRVFWFDEGGTTLKKCDSEDYEPENTIRISEAYLNRAEAYVLSESANVAGALADLNELRRNRIVGYTDVSITDSEALLEEIRKERRLELCFDFHRWFDLRRYGMHELTHEFRYNKANALQVYTLREKDPLWTLPIPQLIMEGNIQLEQNASAYEPMRQGIAQN